MNAIDALFRTLRTQRRKAFIPFLTAGDPDAAATVRLGGALVEAGADLLELGFPYSDPIADGPVIQASYTRVLEHGFRLEEAFTCGRGLADDPKTSAAPRVAMVSYSLIQRRGPDAFLRRTAEAGFSGAIVPDLPYEESLELCKLAAGQDLKLIHLVTPTTPRSRAVEIARRSTGFLYCVSVSGITGERDRLPDALLEQLAWLRRQTDLPLCVGFGVSRPEHVRSLREVVDGVIVGSALVRRVEQACKKPLEEIAAELAALTRTLVAALNPPG
jgi:tryptophan synthase alpha chain